MKKLLVIAALMFSSNAFAGILLEPYVGYATGTIKQTGATDRDLTGMGYGARLGYSLPIVWFALDYFAQSGADVKQGSTTSDADASVLGVVVGANLPIIRVWAGYNFQNDVDVTASGTTNKLEGDSMKFGLGYKLPMIPISINAEYNMVTLDKMDGTSLTNKQEGKIWFLSVSAPFDF